MRTHHLLAVLLLLAPACKSKIVATAEIDAGVRSPALPIGGDAPLELSKPDETRVKLDLVAIRAEVSRRKESGSPPPASVAELGIRLHFPADIDYDPRTGEVHSKTYPRF
jgi:hypothetical protein